MLFLEVIDTGRAVGLQADVVEKCAVDTKY